MRFRGLIDEGSLWIMIAVPSIWAAHFLLCYWIAAVWCAKVSTTDLSGIGWWIWPLTGAALAGIALLALKAVRGYAGKLVIDDDLDGNTDDERKQFLGHATLLLCVLSAIAILFNVAPVLVFDRCW